MDISFAPIRETDIALMDDWLSGSDLGEFMSGWKPRAVRRGDWCLANCRWNFILLDGVKIGTVSLEREQLDSRIADLAILIADRANRNRGIGSKTIRLMLREVREDWGTTNIRLRVRANNVAAIACYKKLGFVTVGTATKQHDGLEMSVLHMELDLGASGAAGG